jgi:hypothetical protein
MAEFDLVIRSGNVVTAELASQKADLFQPNQRLVLLKVQQIRPIVEGSLLAVIASH